MSDSLQPHRLYHIKLLCPWDSPGKNTGVGCHSLLQGIISTQWLNLGPLSLSLAGYSSWGHKELDKTEQLILNSNDSGVGLLIRFKVCACLYSFHVVFIDWLIQLRFLVSSLGIYVVVCGLSSWGVQWLWQVGLVAHPPPSQHVGS